MIHVSTVRAVLFCTVAGLAPSWVTAQAPDTLTLDQAIERVVLQHPDMRIDAVRQRVLAAEQQVAGQRPAWRAGIDVENVLGTGAYSGIGGAEIGLSLGSVFERGDKREARLALAGEQRHALTAQAQARHLDLLAEVARRYLDLVAAQEARVIAEADVAEREATVGAAQRRVSAGAAPASAALMAKAAYLEAAMSADSEQVVQAAAWRRLAILWGESAPGIAPAVLGEPLALPAIEDMDALHRLLDDTPALRRFADQQRIAEARLRLAQAQREVDIDWQVGVRRLQDGGDWALLAGVSIPLGSARRAEPGIQAAQAELALVAVEREGHDLALRATLVEAHSQYQAMGLRVARYRSEVIPALLEAAESAGRAYRAGALSYLEWAQLQSQVVQARRQQLAAAVSAWQSLIEIQRLTARPFLLPADANPENPS